jgi:hypothetical protein
MQQRSGLIDRIKHANGDGAVEARAQQHVLRDHFKLIGTDQNFGRRNTHEAAAYRYLRQKVWVNSTRTLKISSRPSSMAAVQTQAWKSVRDW